MRHRIDFAKVSGAGNDFVLIDRMKGEVPMDPAVLARVLCSRPFGIGADGLLLLEPSDRADFRMRYFNADGSTGGMCGNGGRCIAMTAYRRGYAAERMQFDALGHLYRAEVTARERIRLEMKDPVRMKIPLELETGGRRLAGGFIDTGAPHAVFLVDDLEALDVAGIGRSVRHAPAFSPEGTNVNFVRPAGEHLLVVRTYERGVEAETLACGTGSVAAAVLSAQLGRAKPPVEVRVRSGESLTVGFALREGHVTNVTLEGTAHILFTGRVLVDDTSLTIHPLDT